MASVYRVRHSQLGSMHALKILKLRGEGIRRRLLREGRVQAMLNHPNLVSVTDVVEVDGSPALVMEYIDGPSLDDFLGRYRLTLPQANELAVGILRGVSEAHKHGLVHRDLKPGNILLQPVDDDLIPKVADFGLAKVLAEAFGPSGGSTRSGTTMGTPGYMPPEQIRDSKVVDARADVFALGAILFEMVCDRKAFAGPDIVEVYRKVTEGVYTDPRELCPELSVEHEAAIRRALLIEPTERFASAVELLAAWKVTTEVDRWEKSILRGERSEREGGSTSTFNGFDVESVRRSRTTSPMPWEAEVADPVAVSGVPGASSYATPAKTQSPRIKAALGVVVAGVLGGVIASHLATPEPPVIEAAVVGPVVGTPGVVEPVNEPVEPVAPEPVSQPSALAVPRPPAATGSTSPVGEVQEPDLSVPPGSEVEEEPAATASTEVEEVVTVPSQSAGVTVSGDARSVWVESDEGRWRAPVELPAGSYTLKAFFSDDEVALTMGRLELEAGDSVEVHCKAAFRRCEF